MLCFSALWRSSVVPRYTRAHRTMDSPRLEIPQGPLVPRSAQSKVSAEFRAVRLGPSQAGNAFRDRDSTPLPLKPVALIF